MWCLRWITTSQCTMSSAFTRWLTVVFVNECQCCGLRPWSYDKTVSDQCRSWSWSCTSGLGLGLNMLVLFPIVASVLCCQMSTLTLATSWMWLHWTWLAFGCTVFFHCWYWTCIKLYYRTGFTAEQFFFYFITYLFNFILILVRMQRSWSWSWSCTSGLGLAVSVLVLVL